MYLDDEIRGINPLPQFPRFGMPRWDLMEGLPPREGRGAIDDLVVSSRLQARLLTNFALGKNDDERRRAFEGVIQR
jgi:hypothetical protein